MRIKGTLEPFPPALHTLGVALKRGNVIHVHVCGWCVELLVQTTVMSNAGVFLSNPT